MEVRICQRVATAALLVALAGCTSDDDGEGVANPPGGGSGSNPANVLADLDPLIADADAYLYTASIRREDAGFSLRSDPGDLDLGPFYEWDAPEELDRTTVGTLSVEVPGDAFPGLGTLTLPRTPLDGLAADGPLNVESTVRWEPPGDGGTIVIGFDIDGEGVNEDGDRDFLGIGCVTADDGEFRVPDATLARLPEGVDGVGTLYAERERIDVLPTGESIAFLIRHTLRVVYGSE